MSAGHWGGSRTSSLHAGKFNHRPHRGGEAGTLQFVSDAATGVGLLIKCNNAQDGCLLPDKRHVAAVWLQHEPAVKADITGFHITGRIDAVA